MAWNDDLLANTPAYEIASSNHNRIRVMAGPGAGKSFAMKRRVARILEMQLARSTEVLAVTFTRVAAEDLQRELASLNVPGSEHLKGKTIHGLAMSILRRAHVLETLGRTPRPLNKFELEPLVEDLGHVHGNKRNRKRLLIAYGAAWARLQTQQPGYTRTREEQAFFRDLMIWLRLHSAMLVDEIVPHLYEYLISNPGSSERAEYRHVLVDEYQDLNKVEQEVIQLLGENASICIIGDDDQSIYSFRHAHPEGICQWSTLHQTDEHSIGECRRCPITIVRMANQLIQNNTGRVEGRSMVERGDNGIGEVVIRQYNSVVEEVVAVVNKIAELVSSGVLPNEIIVLTQRETFAKPIFQQLKDRGIATKSYFAESELDNVIAQERFAILKLLLNNEDRVALRWLLGYGDTKWRSSSYKRLMNYVRTNSCSPWEAMIDLTAGVINIQYTSSLIARFQEIQKEIAILKSVEGDIGSFIDLWLPKNERTELLAEAVDQCRGGVFDAQGLYDALYEKITQPEIPMEVSEVRIMSLHKSKGLSSPFVFIVGCVEGLLPVRADLTITPEEQQAKLEEDRRLFYVGITRVKAKPPERLGYLAISYSQKMTAADAYFNNIKPVRVIQGVAYLQASRFIGEMMPFAPQAESNTPL